MNGGRTPNPTKLPGFPKVPSDTSPAQRAYLTAITEALEVRLGRRGDPRDAAVTYRDLIDGGLAVEGLTVGGGGGGGGSGGVAIIPSGDDGNFNTDEPSVPEPPSGLLVTGGFKVIFIDWDFPFDTYYGHSFTEIWRNDIDQLGNGGAGDAQLIGVSYGMMYVDDVGSDAGFYYWARHVNVINQRGPWNSLSGTFGQSAVDVTFLLGVLTDSITQDELATDLSAEIDMISIIDTAVDLVEADILAAQGLIGTLQNEVVTLTSATATNATAITGLNTTVGNNSSNIISLLSTTANSAAAITSLQTTSTNQGGSIAANASALSGLTTRVTNAEGSITSTSSDVTVLQNDLAATNASVGANASAVSNLTSTVSSQNGQITAAVNSVNALSTTVGQNTTSVAVNASSINGVMGKYGVTIDSNGTVAGFGLLNGATGSSAFYVNADKFAVGTSSTSSTLPFAVITSAIILNGMYVTPGTYIANAMIAAGTIDEVKIGVAAVGTARIKDLAVQTAKIDNLAITGAKIQDAAITSAKIGNAQINTLQLGGEAVTVPRFATGSASGTLTGSTITVASLYLSAGYIPPGTSGRIIIMGALSAYPQNTTATNLIVSIYTGNTLNVNIGVTYRGDGISVPITGSFPISGTYADTISLRVSCTSNPNGASSKSGNSFSAKLTVMAAKR